MTMTAKKMNTTTTEVKNNGQLDALDNLPNIFENMPTVPTNHTAQVVTLEQEGQTLESLKDAAFAEKVNIDNALKSDSRTEFAKAMSKGATACKAYNDALLKTLFDSFLLNAEPMQEFMRVGFYKRVKISVSEGKDGTNVSIKEVDTILPLSHFEAYANTMPVFRSKSWKHTVQRVTALLSIRAAQDIGTGADVIADMINNFEMDEAARGMIRKDVNPRAKDPLSNNSLADAMQDMLDAVLYIQTDKKHNEYRVVSSAVNYFLYIAFRRGTKPGTIATPKASTMEKYLVELGHLLVNKANFRIEYEKIKNVETSAA